MNNYIGLIRRTYYSKFDTLVYTIALEQDEVITLHISKSLLNDKELECIEDLLRSKDHDNMLIVKAMINSKNKPNDN